MKNTTNLSQNPMGRDQWPGDSEPPDDFGTCGNSWIEDLKNGDAAAQLAAAEGLAGLGKAAQPAIVELIQRCGSESEAIRNWCVSALEDVGCPNLGQIDELLLLASAANENIAYWAITLLGRLGDDAIRAMPILIERLGDDSAPALQRRAAWALGRLGGSVAKEALHEAANGLDRALVAQARSAIEQIAAA